MREILKPVVLALLLVTSSAFALPKPAVSALSYMQDDASAVFYWIWPVVAFCAISWALIRLFKRLVRSLV